MQAPRLTLFSIVTCAALLALGLTLGVTSKSAAAEPAQTEAILLPWESHFACQMVDDGNESRAWVYCWDGGSHGTRHVKLNAEGGVSLVDTVPSPIGLGGPGNPPGTWRTVGRFRCEVQSKGVECVVIASGKGFRIQGTSIVEVQAQPGVFVPAPVLGQSAVLESASGVVRIKLPGSKFLAFLNGLARVPMGTVIDATRGAVRLSSAAGTAGEAQSGVFRGGVFRVTQPLRAGQPEGLTVLTLVGRLPGRCGGARVRAKAAGASRIGPAARRGSSGRRLWGNAHGEFQTGGRYASATVSGTKWLTVDTCAGTLVAVARGAVSVEDRIHQRTVTVTAGHRYLAHPGGSGPPSGGTSHALIWRALDGKVVCGMAIHPPQQPARELLCASTSVPPPKRDSDSEGDPGFVFLSRTGSPRLARLSQYSFEVENGWDPRNQAALGAGRKWTNSRIGVTCTIGAATVRCANRSGHGFTIGAGYDGF